jgi:hypothetical protein
VHFIYDISFSTQATWVYAILVYRNFEKGLEAIRKFFFIIVIISFENSSLILFLLYRSLLTLLVSRNKNKSNNDDPEVGSSTPGSKVLID